MVSLCFCGLETLPINVKQGPHCEKFPQNGVFDEFFTNWWKMFGLFYAMQVFLLEKKHMYLILTKCSNAQRACNFSPPNRADSAKCTVGEKLKRACCRPAKRQSVRVAGRRKDKACELPAGEQIKRANCRSTIDKHSMKHSKALAVHFECSF